MGGVYETISIQNLLSVALTAKPYGTGTTTLVDTLSVGTGNTNSAFFTLSNTANYDIMIIAGSKQITITNRNCLENPLYNLSVSPSGAIAFVKVS
jgi:hypothetical protein